MTEAPGLAAAYDRVATHLVGRERELTLVLAAVAALVGLVGDTAVMPRARGPSSSAAILATSAESAPPEKATNAEP